ncbi:MAG: hypothetical protein HIU85_07040 [Proteobacteria bacterium]|nr:hypothetical protein [Pseudomonadota bacterium]
MAVHDTAESRSLASLEVLVHTEDTHDLAAIERATIPVDIDDALIEIADPPAPSPTRQLGSRPAAESRSVALRVPRG